jgi:hypothetical protein
VPPIEFAEFDRRPIPVAIAGPIGAGKTRLIHTHLAAAGLRYVNADVLVAGLAVWLVLYRDTRPGETSRASLGDIARRAGIDRQTASRAVGKLARRRMLEVLRRGGLSQGPSEYRIFPYPMEATTV